MKNWKTTLGGILSATVAGLLYTNKIDQTQSVYLLGAVGFLIGLFSKDTSILPTSRSFDATSDEYGRVKPPKSETTK